MAISNNSNRRSAKEIFFEAIEKATPDERAAFLDDACGHDPLLRQQVEELLAGHFEQDNFMHKPAVDAAAVAAPAAPISEAPGSRIGRYKLLEQIGEGGMGVVYMAEQEEPVRRRVAFKIIKLGMDTKQVVARFEAERQALALMDHPNIARVLDGGATDTGRPYFVMELVQGVPITEFCDKNQLSIEERLKLFIPVCQAIQSAHQKGIIHRDLKPTNILVTLDGGVPHPMVIDFGVAKATNQKLTEKTVFTRYATMIGTPAYMSPEQAEMSRLDVDTRTDIYGLGVLLYELLTGTTPFAEERLRSAGYHEMQRIILQEQPERPSTRLRRTQTFGKPVSARSTLHAPRSTDLDWIVMKCLEKDRARRYATANGLAADVQRHLDNEPVVARPPSRLYRFQKLVRRNKLVCAAAAAVAASLLFGIIASMQEAARARRAEQQQVRLRSEALTTLEASDFDDANRLIKADDASAAAAHLLRILSTDPGNRAALSQLAMLLTYHSWMVPTLVLKHADRVNTAEFSPDGRRIVTASADHTARVWDAQTGQPLAAAMLHPDEVASAHFSPDGKRVVTASADHTARVWDVQTGQLLAEMRHDGGLYGAEFSPDGTRIVTASEDNTARVWDAQTGKPLTPPLRHNYHVFFAQFSPDGKRVATASKDFTARVWDARTGQPLTQPLEHANWVYSAQFSPDGKRVLTASVDDCARLWDAQTGEPLLRLPHGIIVYSAQFSPDGKRIVTAGEDHTARVWDPQTGQLLTGPLRHGEIVWKAQFSPDGKRIVTASWDGTARVWDAQTGLPLTGPMHHGNHLSSAQFSPDGRRIVTAADNNTALIWDAPVGRALPLSLADPNLVCARFSRDGKRVVTASRDGAARVWDAQTGQPLTPPLQHGRGVHDAEFSPDGTRVATASLDHTARIWDALTGQPLTEPLEHGDRVETTEFSPDGKCVVTASYDQTAKIWDVQTGRQLTEPLKHSDYVDLAHFSPDGKKIVTASRDNTARIWDPQTGRALTPPLTHGSRVTCAQFSSDGRRVVTASWDRTARIWDAQTGQPLTGPLKHRDFLYFAQFSPDARLIVTASLDHTARVWDAQTGQPLTQPMKHDSPLYSAEFSPDGRWLVTRFVQREIVTLAPVLFSPDGQWILTASSGARVWDAHTGLPLTEPLEYRRFLQLGPDAKSVETRLEDDAARVWDVGFVPSKLPDWLLPLAEALSGKRLNLKGDLEETMLDRGRVIAQTRQDLNSRPDGGDGVKWGRWLLADPRNRTISPLSTLTVSTYIENSLKRATGASLNQAVSPDLPPPPTINERARESLDEAARLALGDPDLLHRVLALRDRALETGLLQSNATHHARAGQWTNAIAEYSRLIELEPNEHWYHFYLAPLLVQSGELEGYRRHCAHMLALFGATNNPVIAERIAKACLIVPAKGIDLDTAARLADIAVTRGNGYDLFPYFELTKGLAEYRQAHFTSAIDWMQRVLSSSGVVDNRDASAWLVLAMAQHQSGKPVEARAAVHNAAQIISTKMPTLESGDIGDAWNDWIIAHALLKEAKGLIEGDKPHNQQTSGAETTRADGLRACLRTGLSGGRASHWQRSHRRIFDLYEPEPPATSVLPGPTVP